MLVRRIVLWDIKSKERGVVVVAPVPKTSVGCFAKEGGEVWDVDGKGRIGRWKLKLKLKLIYLLN